MASMRMHGCYFLAVQILHFISLSIYMHLYNPKASSALKAKDLSKLSSMDTTMLALIFSLAFFLIQGANSTTFTFVNKCPYTVWPAAQQHGGSPLSPTGFLLSSGSTVSQAVAAGWSGRFWARHHCTPDSSGKFSCLSGDCGTGQIPCNGARSVATPTTFVEFTINGDDANDLYDVSLIDGFNVPMSVIPQGGSGSCGSTACPGNIIPLCPPKLLARSPGGDVVGCNSPCLAFNTDQYCCRGAYEGPTRCPPSEYTDYFKSSCPQAHSYAYNHDTIFTCNRPAGYLITFCP